jgi:UDP-N-acetylmuramoyl-tripeptide--D-alanyl-D-alanine ligase
MNLRLGELAAVVHGTTAHAHISVTGLSTDTRTLQPGDIYVALKGERFDGHDFVRQAQAKGASAVVVANTFDPDYSEPALRVSDTLTALQSIAADWRSRFNIPVIAVAGSNGKTTTTQMLAKLLGHLGDVHATQGTLNNHIGVPLTLLGIRSHHRAAVIEIGANHPGEVAHLTTLVKPTIGLVTNAGAEHLEGFGSVAGAARAEGELFEWLGPQALGIINMDDAHIDIWRQQAQNTSLRTFSLRQPADVQLISDVQVEANQQRFSVSVDARSFEVCLPLAGSHNVANALAAMAAATAVGVPMQAIIKALAQIVPVKGRLQFKSTAQGGVLIDDSYNANPSSVTAALQVLMQQPAPRGVILGGMGELGEQSVLAHEQVGREARQLGVQWLWTVGGDAKYASQTFGSPGRHFDSVELLIQSSQRELPAFGSLLVKGSRFNRLERVVDGLINIGVPTAGVAACSTT